MVATSSPIFPPSKRWLFGLGLAVSPKIQLVLTFFNMACCVFFCCAHCDTDGWSQNTFYQFTSFGLNAALSSGCFHIRSSLRLVQTEGNKTQAALHFSAVLAPLAVCSGPKLVDELTNKPKRSNASHVRAFALFIGQMRRGRHFPELLFDWFEITCRKIPTSKQRDEEKTADV